MIEREGPSEGEVREALRQRRAPDHAPAEQPGDPGGAYEDAVRREMERHPPPPEEGADEPAGAARAAQQQAQAAGDGASADGAATDSSDEEVVDAEVVDGGEERK